MRIKKKVSNLEPQYNLEMLQKQMTRQEFVIGFSNKFRDQDSQEVIWGQIKNIYNKSALKTLGYQKKPKDQWLSNHTWNLIEERRITKLQLLSSHSMNQMYQNKTYRLIDESVKKSVHEDTCHFYKAKAAKNGKSRLVYKIANAIFLKRKASEG